MGVTISGDGLGTTVPQGRLTLSTGLAVMTSNISGSTSIYYTPYLGNLVPIASGSTFNWTVFTELTNTTTDATKNPAAVAANKNYDLFVWSDAGTIRLGRGPAWSTDTSRGTGVGTTELQLVNGIYTNKVAITNGPAANAGTYVGTVRSNGSSQIDWNTGAVAAGGTAGLLGVWNMYNRILFTGFIGDNTNSWAMAGGTWRSANSSTTMRVSFVQGIVEDVFEATYDALATASGGNAYVGVTLNGTSTPGGKAGVTYNPGIYVPIVGRNQTQSLGWNFFQAVENNVAVSVTFIGDNGDTTQYTGLSYRGMF